MSWNATARATSRSGKQQICIIKRQVDIATAITSTKRFKKFNANGDIGLCGRGTRSCVYSLWRARLLLYVYRQHARKNLSKKIKKCRVYRSYKGQEKASVSVIPYPLNGSAHAMQVVKGQKNGKTIQLNSPHFRDQNTWREFNRPRCTYTQKNWSYFWKINAQRGIKVYKEQCVQTPHFVHSASWCRFTCGLQETLTDVSQQAKLFNRHSNQCTYGISASQYFNIIYMFPHVHFILFSVTLNTTPEYPEQMRHNMQWRLGSCKICCTVDRDIVNKRTLNAVKIFLLHL